MATTAAMSTLVGDGDTMLSIGWRVALIAVLSLDGCYVYHSRQALQLLGRPNLPIAICSVIFKDRAKVASYNTPRHCHCYCCRPVWRFEAYNTSLNVVHQLIFEHLPTCPPQPSKWESLVDSTPPESSARTGETTDGCV